MDSPDIATVPSPEIINPSEHPVNQVDHILNEVATKDFADDTLARRAIYLAAEGMVDQAKFDQDYWTGRLDPAEYKRRGVDAAKLSKIRSTETSSFPPNFFGEGVLRRLGQKGSEKVVTAIARRMGVLSEFQTMADLMKTDKWYGTSDNQGRYSGGVAISLEDRPELIEKMYWSGSPKPETPYVKIIKSYSDDKYARPPEERAGTWSISLILQGEAHHDSLDKPISPSKVVSPKADEMKGVYLPDSWIYGWYSS